MRILYGLLLATFPMGLHAAVYGDPPDAHHPWAIHDDNRPKPPLVTPGTFSTQDQPGKPPSDAIVLFDGKDLSGWMSTKEGNGPAKWAVRDGYMEVVPKEGDIRTREEFGDCQLHVEWAAPTKIVGNSQGRGNSGIFLMGICEVQVLDTYNNPSYADGMAGSVYGVNPPMANAVRPPGEYQVYDIVFRRPIYRDGRVLDPGYVTVLVNGVLVQDHTPLEGPTGHMRRTKPGPFPETGPLKLQDHGNPMRFRNIWYRKLAPRALEGGTDGWLTEQATTAKRQLIAADIRADAGKNPPGSVDQMLRNLESLCYASDAATEATVTGWSSKYVADLKALPADQLASRKDEVKKVYRSFSYMDQHHLLPSGFTANKDLEIIVKAQRWDK